ncbi:MAG: metal-dependent hydrolase [Nanoarchaeota archaeon]|nr:metal-dependent hydrolase [Nanoarchaeota archaeon]
MSFGFTHLIIAWFAGKVYQFATRKKIRQKAWFFLLLGGVLPDIDFLLDWTLGTELHRTFTHSLFFVVVAPLLVYLLFRFLGNKNSFSFMYAIAGGIMTHLMMDMFFSAGVPLFWPSLLHFSYTSVTYFDPATPSFLNAAAPALRRFLESALVDMALGVSWIFYLWSRKRIQF